MATVDPITTFDDDAVQRMERSAWLEAAKAWSEYHSARRSEDTGALIRVRGEGRARREARLDAARSLSQMLHDAAWSAEHHWRGLHDERLRRGLPLTHPTTPQQAGIALA